MSSFAAQAASQLYLSLLKEVLTASLYDESAWVWIEGRRGPADRNLLRPARYITRLLLATVVNRLGANDMILIRKRPFSAIQRETGNDWPLFGYTMIGLKRLENLQNCIDDVINNNIPGDLIETGVWRGGATIFMRAMLKSYKISDRIVWVADSFEGLPAPKDGTDGSDLSHVKTLAVPVEQVKRNFERFGLLDEQVRFIKGWFSETLHTAPIEKLAILRLDGDLYSSTMDALNALYPKVSIGGYVIIDDYGSWPSCKRAVHEYIAKRGIQADIRDIDGSGVFWRVEAPAPRRPSGSRKRDKS
jgi:O-methyltransferase